MSPTISLSRRSVEGLLWLAEDRGPGAWSDSCRDDTIYRLRLALNAKRLRPRSLKAKSRRDETAEIRRLVFERAGSAACECCDCVAVGGELDHFWGRGKAPQTVANCWWLCRMCHHQKTNSIPGARFWLARFGAHALAYGYHAEAERARARLEGMVAVRDSERSRLSTDEGRGP